MSCSMQSFNPSRNGTILPFISSLSENFVIKSNKKYLKYRTWSCARQTIKSDIASLTLSFPTDFPIVPRC